ncbi:Endonuclease/exonuclease/phosphatase [Mycotypha africana]|uniref:Endonuclease/exonuclease/phosphatase n=1 Tax=Mycotypha africana TaxID=64632 RepID=UPI0023019981|nr:Endonuclease/exonuclease/phosphatase [Mycotypha africana]KAI8973493.1 Endonuclease/exonuclease/phosphatase [Mycotypha africana]
MQKLYGEKDLQVTFTVKEGSASVIFPEDTMPDMLNKIKELKAEAEKRDLTSTKDNSHEWTKVYKSYVANKDKKGNIVRSNSTPTIAGDKSALRYVMPIERSETLAKINLKRTRTVAAPKSPKITFEAAKDHWINAQLMKRENDFVDWQKTYAFVGTWNVHGSLPTSSLKDWLQNTLKTDDGKAVDPDFYIIGLEEMETNTEAYIRYDPTKENAWVKAIIESLKDGGNDYYRVESKQLVTMLLIVIAKKKHQPHISEVSTAYAGVGLMGMMGNKGGIAVRLRYHDSYMCFVTSHLAAFTDKTEKRNQDFTELSKRLIFPHKLDPLLQYVSYFWNDGGDEGVTFVESNNVIKDWSTEASLYHNDFLIWCGDLNYRINLPEGVVKHWLRQDRLDVLLNYDQLSIERSAGRTFPMFEEGQIQFPPTYKYDAGTNQYDTSEKRRAPSWTDRILWKKERNDSPKQSLRLLSYTHCMNMMMSDHKPVRALMELNVRKINSQRQRETRDTLVKQLKDNPDIQPRGQISSSYVDFGKVHFIEYKEKIITLENTGQVLTVFKFLPKNGSKGILPPWLLVAPLSGVVAPGEKVVIRFEVTVDPTISAPLNRGEQKLDDILILRLENSKDFFICVSGEYVPTCFGVPLEQLSEMAVPISEEAAKNLQGVASRKSSSSADSSLAGSQPILNQIDLPKELWKVLNFLWNPNMFQIESLFLEHGDLNVSTYIRECLDNGEQFDTNVLLGNQQLISADTTTDKTESEMHEVKSSLSGLTLADEHNTDGKITYDEDDDDNEEVRCDLSKEAISANSMIDVLVAFLECLPEPVVTTTNYARALEAGDSLEIFNTIKDSLPPFHRNVLLYIGMFLSQAIEKAPASVRKARENKIVETFTVLLRPPIDFKEHNPVVAKEKRENFVRQLLKSVKS